ncbi:MAG: hypothetical protein GXY20_01445 [Clostridiales bacterium]|nr:hypothetical protein [Clostridiales bacterium]NLV49339.1 hypothetical protein [Clostridiales bacterium]
MKIELTQKEFRRLLDLVYVGNWILNSTRGTSRIKDYDNLESKLFSYCIKAGMYSLFEVVDNEILPSLQFADGGIHEAIMDYEDTVFYEILAEELARRDMDCADIDPGNMDELTSRIDEYIQEFETNGVDNITLEK